MTSVNGAQAKAATPLRPARGGVRAIAPHEAAIAGCVLLAALIAVFWVFTKQQVLQAFEQPADWGHTLFVPFMSGYFAWLKRDEILAKPFKANWFGLPIVVLGVAAYVAATFGPSWFVLHHNARGIAIGVTLFGLALQILGWRATRGLEVICADAWRWQRSGGRY
jgi:hypothetical protein